MVGAAREAAYRMGLEVQLDAALAEVVRLRGIIPSMTDPKTVNNVHQTDTTITRYRRKFANSRFGATPAHENLNLLNHTWRAGVLERQTVTYGAWEETTEGT